MRQSNSADPWSTFLGPAEQRSGKPEITDSTGARRRGPDDLDLEGGLSEPGRRVLDLLGSDRGALPIDQVAERLDMGLLDVAETVQSLETRGLIQVRHTGTRETVELTERGSGD